MDENPDWNESNVFEILPETYKAHLTTFRPYLRGYNAILRLNITNKIEAEDWLKDFSEKSLTNYRVDRTFPENTPKVLFKKEYRCLHANKPGSPKIKTPHSKHNACRAKLTITIKQRGMKRSKDKYLKDYPCEVMLRYIHNHPVAFKDAVKNKPCKEAQESILDLFSKGHSPTTALEVFKQQLREEHGDDCLKVIEDPIRCPTQKWCYSLYYNTYKRKHLSDDSDPVDKDQGDDGGEDDDDSASLTD